MTTITDLIHTLEASKQTGEPIVMDTETFTTICKFMTMLGSRDATASLADVITHVPAPQQSVAPPDPQRLITIKEAMKRIGISRATLDRLRKRDATFPKPMAITSRSKRFFASEIDLWLSQQQDGSR